MYFTEVLIYSPAFQLPVVLCNATLGSKLHRCSSLPFSDFNKRQWQKATCRRKVYLTYIFLSQSVIEGSQGKKLSWKWSRGHRRMLLARLLPDSCSASFLTYLGGSAKGMVPLTVGWPMCIKEQTRESPHRHTLFDLDNLSTDILFSNGSRVWQGNN